MPSKIQMRGTLCSLSIRYATMMCCWRRATSMRRGSFRAPYYESRVPQTPYFQFSDGTHVRLIRRAGMHLLFFSPVTPEFESSVSRTRHLASADPWDPRTINRYHPLWYDPSLVLDTTINPEDEHLARGPRERNGLDAAALRRQLNPEERHAIEERAETDRRKIKSNLQLWTSNTVLIVDRSGSMRSSDMWGARNRLSSVWIAIALDFIAHRLESGAACETDIISLVTLEEHPEVLIKEQPCTWALRNKLVALYNNETVTPRGHGPFLPCLEKAEKLLLRNSFASCAMALCFLSDGKPSDATVKRSGKSTLEYCEGLIAERVASLAKKFGRRLTFTAIGIGDIDDFSTLEKMVDAAKDYGAIATLQLPSMSSSSLGLSFTSVATSLTTTQLEMTDVTSLKQRKVRDVERESRRRANQQLYHVSPDEFFIYRKEKVKRKVYTERFNEERKLVKRYEVAPLQHPDAQYVALCRGTFGEGAERIAFRFFEIASDARTIVGPPLVAKESRLVLDEGVGDEASRKAFVRTFCSTQQLARRIAEEFNDKLDRTYRVDKRTPRIAFLDCSVYQLRDNNLGESSVLVEEKLDHEKWHKWNANNGFVEGMKSAPVMCEMSIRDTMAKMAQRDLAIVEEGSEEDEESDDEDEVATPSLQPVCFTASEVAQAFSHFSYLATGRKRLICDLQGVFDQEANVLRLSDPVIHYYHSGRSDRRFVHGRTDRGRKGMAMFFETHHEHCGHLCKLVNRGFRRVRNHRQTTTHQSASHGTVDRY